MSKLFLGVDISKVSFDVALLFLDGKVKTKKFSNNTKGFSQLIEWLNRHKAHDLHICMEATGIYSEALATFLFDLGYIVSVVNPAQIKGFAQSELARNKTDRADSQVIARFCRAINPKPWQPKPLHIRELQALVRRLEALQNMLQQEDNRKEVSSKVVQSSIESVRKKLEKEISIVKDKIRDHINNHPDLRDKGRLLKTIPGVGEATIAQVLAFIGNIEDFKNAKQLAAFVGLNPKQRQSGSSVNGRTRLSKVGNSNLRKAFFMPAVSAKRYNPIIRSFCEKLKASGKPTMLIVGAAMRKLVHIIFGVLKSGKPFDATLARIG
jgi:transposase